MAKDKWEVKGVKAVRGHDGQGFNASLYLNSKRVALVDDDGWGGGYQYEWLDRKAQFVKIHTEVNGQKCSYNGTPMEAKWMEYVYALPEAEYEGMKLGHCPDIAIGDLMAIYEEQKWLKRNSKKSTLFRIKGDEAGSWRTIGQPWSERVSAAIVKKFGAANIETIFTGRA